MRLNVRVLALFGVPAQLRLGRGGVICIMREDGKGIMYCLLSCELPSFSAAGIKYLNSKHYYH
jgi:hypothetical protein